MDRLRKLVGRLDAAMLGSAWPTAGPWGAPWPTSPSGTAITPAWCAARPPDGALWERGGTGV